SPITPPPPRSLLFPYTTLFRSRRRKRHAAYPDCSFCHSAVAVRRRWLCHSACYQRGETALGRSSSATIAAHRSFCRGSVALLRQSEEHTSELQSRFDLVCRLLL